MKKILNINWKLSVFEIALIAIVLSLAITSKFFDRFIPHVHFVHYVVLIIGISLLRFFNAVILIVAYTLITMLFFPGHSPTPYAMIGHLLNHITLLLVWTFKLFKQSKTRDYVILPSVVFFTLLLYLFIMTLADSEYTRISSPKTPFMKRVYLALIYPGDWMKITVTAAIAVPLTPIVFSTLNPIIETKLKY